MKYVAYGSNMNLEQMAVRCPGARLVGTGLLRGYQLEFNRHATIVPTNNPDAVVPVAVWEITAQHEYRLDNYEGFPRYYRKLNCTVDLAEGKRIQGMVYQMCAFDYFPPHEAYYAGICDAYESHGLRSEIKQVLLPALMRSYRRAGN